MTIQSPPAIEIKNLNFDYGGPRIIENLNLTVPIGARCLLVGANGAGKTTLLRIIAGKRMCKQPVLVTGHEGVQMDVFFRQPEGITYLGNEWANNPIVRMDIGVRELVKSMNGDKFPERRDILLHILDVNQDWRMHQCSDGERRRVQLVLGLLNPWKICLLDEVVIDLDILVRSDFLRYLKKDTEERNSTILYATHIFDDVTRWATHIAHISFGSIVDFHPMNDFPLLNTYQQNKDEWESPLMRLCIDWLRQDRAKRKEPRGISSERILELKDKLIDYSDVNDTNRQTFYTKYNYYD